MANSTHTARTKQVPKFTTETAKQLLQFGLEPRQIKIYLTLLKHGTQTPLELSRTTSISRASIYRHLEKLQQLGLTEEIVAENSTRYKASSPEKLEFVLTQKEASIESLKKSLPAIVSSLSAIEDTSSGPTEVTYYRGVNGLRQLLWDLTKCKSKDTVNYGYLTWNEWVGFKFAEKVRQEMVHQNVYGREITNSKANEEPWTENFERVTKYYKERYIPKKILTIHHDLYIYDDFISFYHFYKREYFGIKIHNPEIAKTQRQIFDILWKMGKDVKPWKGFKV